MKRISFPGIFPALAVVFVLATAPSPAVATAAPTTTTLTITSSGSAVSTVASGTVVTLTATVTAGTTPVTTGRVNFCDASAKYCEDIHILASAQLTRAGNAIVNFRTGTGSHSLKAVFVGTTTYATSASAASPLTVSAPTAPLPTITLLTDGVATVQGNQPIPNGGSLGPAPPTGTLSFVDTNNANFLLATVQLAPNALQLDLTSYESLVVGSVPAGLVAADFNGDGFPDLAIVENDQNAVLIFLGDGLGSFNSVSSSPSTGGSPNAIATADFNGDGIPDLAIANQTGNTLTILLGKGDGTFTAAASPSTGTTPIALAVGDFNRDGIPDLAVANSGSATVSIFLGKGDGTFTPAASSPSTGASPNSIAVADFDGDGIPDLAVLNTGPGTVSILLGNGDGTFTSASTSPSIGANSYSLASADFNGDGIPDLAVSTNNPSGVPSTLNILLGNGDGTFAAPLTTQCGTYPILAVGDFNGDGIADLVIDGGVWLGNGDATFTALQGGINGYPENLVAADFNGDGLADLAVSQSQAYTGGAHGYATVSTAGYTSTANVPALYVVGTGDHEIQANYSGDSLYGSSTSTYGQQVQAQLVPTKLAIQLNNSSIAANQTVSLTATLTPQDVQGHTTNGDSINLSLTQPTGPALYVAQGSLQNGVTTISFQLPAGQQALYAQFSGDTNFAASGSSLTVNVSGALTPTIKVTPSTPSITTAQAMSVSVIVSAASGTPTGSVVLTGGSYSSPAVVLAAGAATIPIPGGSLAAGSDTLTLTYTPDTASTGVYVVASGATTVFVTPAAVAVTPSASTVSAAQPLSVAVAVSGGSGNPTPTGTVTLASGSYSTAATPLVSGSASITIPAGSLPTGSDTLTTTYSGDSNYSPATGTALVTVAPPPSGFSLAGTAVSVAPGATTGNTSTITLTPAGGFTGSVTMTAVLATSPAGAIDPPTLSFGSTSPISITGAGAGTATLTISTTPSSTSPCTATNQVRPRTPWYAGGTALACLILFGIPARRRSWRFLLGVFLLLVALGGGVLACGGGGGEGGGCTGLSSSGTTAGGYTITVTGTSGATVATGTVALTVQ